MWRTEHYDGNNTVLSLLCPDKPCRKMDDYTITLQFIFFPIFFPLMIIRWMQDDNVAVSLYKWISLQFDEHYLCHWFLNWGSGPPQGVTRWLWGVTRGLKRSKNLLCLFFLFLTRYFWPLKFSRKNKPREKNHSCGLNCSTRSKAIICNERSQADIV